MKKAEMNMVLVFLILGIVFLVMYLGVMSNFRDVSVFDTLEDKFCKQKISVLSPNAKGTVTEEVLNYFTVQLYEFQKRCQTRVAEIKSDDWSKCNPDWKLLSSSSRDIAARNCAIQQIAELTRRCWDMNGAGRLNGVNWACFNVVIGESSKESRDATIALREKVKALFECDTDSANADCPSRRKEVLDGAATLLVTYDGYISYHEDFIKQKLGFCASKEALFNEKELVITNEVTGSSNTNQVAIDDWYSEIYFEYSSSGTLPDRLISPYFNESKALDEINLCEVNEASPEIKIMLEKIKSAEEERAPVINSIVDSYCSSRSPGNECPEESSAERISIIRDVALTISGAPILDRITEEDFKDFMSRTEMLNQDRLYSNFIGELEFRNGEAIREGATFQIVYCDGFLPITSGLQSQKICGTGKKILISNTLDAGGLRLAQEDFRASCPLTETAAGIIDTAVTRTMVNICQTVTT